MSRAPGCRGAEYERYAIGKFLKDPPPLLLTCLGANEEQGFGVSARSTADARKLDPTGIVTFRQADIGEYLREEDTLFTT